MFTSNKNNLTDGMVLYTSEEEYLMLNSLSNAHQFQSNSDFFTIEITGVEKVITRSFWKVPLRGPSTMAKPPMKMAPSA